MNEAWLPVGGCRRLHWVRLEGMVTRIADGVVIARFRGPSLRREFRSLGATSQTGEGVVDTDSGPERVLPSRTTGRPARIVLAVTQDRWCNRTKLQDSGMEAVVAATMAVGECSLVS